jgi:hypothetical protein
MGAVFAYLFFDGAVFLGVHLQKSKSEIIPHWIPRRMENNGEA